ncbi:MAG: guanylate kinase [Chloroflexi bacterium]|nr:MAG: guanylate kinase [Chloroflexota bacterium]
MIVVVSGPSGVGKDALLARIRERSDRFVVPVTMTTRAPRPGETDGFDYIFVTREAFLDAIERGELLEHAEVYGNFYGVPRSQLRGALSAGRDVIMRVDVQGAATLRGVVPGAVFVFLAPADVASLEAHLRSRGGEDEDSIQRRLATAAREFEASGEFDHTVLNVEGDLDQAVDAVLTIVQSERARPDRLPTDV